VSPWIIWFLEALEASILNAETALDSVLGRTRFWQLHNQTSMNPRQRKAVERLLEAGPDGFEGGLTTRKYASLTRTSKPTASRELADLREKGVLVASGAGRSVRYNVAWPDAYSSRT
jgi:Fic family protein